MGFPGTWMTQSGSLIYRVIPKCACSTIGQILYHLDHGTYYDGDIHDATSGLHKWAFEESRQPIAGAVLDHTAPIFTCVRNPYTRILSSFFDKICGIQRNGSRYRGNLVQAIANNYGIVVDGEFDQIASFRRFLLYARDTIKYRKPMDPDIHWSPTSSHLSTLIANGGRYDHILTTEDFADGVKPILDKIEAQYPVDLDNVPRFNESEGHGPKRAHPVADYFDDLSHHLMLEMYNRDFELFGYDRDDPSHAPSKHEIDVEEVHVTLFAA